MCYFLLTELISRRVGEKSLAEWLTDFEEASFAYGPVNNIQEVFSDPQVGANCQLLCTRRLRRAYGSDAVDFPSKIQSLRVSQS